MMSSPEPHKLPGCPDNSAQAFDQQIRSCSVATKAAKKENTDPDFVVRSTKVIAHDGNGLGCHNTRFEIVRAANKIR